MTLPLLLGAAVTVVQAGVLIDGTGAAPKRRQAIVVEGTRIKAVGDAGGVSVPDGATVIDLSAYTVLPGLIDAHTHVFLQGESAAEGGYDGNILNQGLAYRAAGWGLGFTFPAEIPYFGGGSYAPAFFELIPPLVRLDYVFHNETFTTLSAQVGADSGGSDHLPLVVELAFSAL